MSVPKNRRKPSQFEVFHNWYRLRRDITDLLFRDFGYSRHKAEKKLGRRFGDVPYEEMNETNKATYDRFRERMDNFDAWFIEERRDTVIRCLRNVTAHVFAANSIYPVYYEELVRRRLHQDEALAACYVLMQELQYAIETLPVDIEVYTRFADQIEKEIALIRAWRKSDNRFKDIIFNPNLNEQEKQEKIQGSL